MVYKQKRAHKMLNKTKQTIRMTATTTNQKENKHTRNVWHCLVSAKIWRNDENENKQLNWHYMSMNAVARQFFYVYLNLLLDSQIWFSIWY